MRLHLYIILLLIVSASCTNNSKIQVDYYENGDTLSVYETHEGIKNGSYKVYFRNGLLKQEGNYNVGLKDGIFRTYFENGDLSEYFVYKNDTLIYLTDFDENGNVIGSALGVIIPKEQNEKRIYYDGDTIHFGYKLMHSMVKNPIIGLDVISFNDDDPDTIESLFHISNKIEYELTNYEIGNNLFALTVYEVDPKDTTFIGWHIDTLTIKILPKELKIIE